MTLHKSLYVVEMTKQSLQELNAVLKKWILAGKMICKHIDLWFNTQGGKKLFYTSRLKIVYLKKF